MVLFDMALSVYLLTSVALLMSDILGVFPSLEDFSAISTNSLFFILFASFQFCKFRSHFMTDFTFCQVRVLDWVRPHYKALDKSGCSHI